MWEHVDNATRCERERLKLFTSQRSVLFSFLIVSTGSLLLLGDEWMLGDESAPLLSLPRASVHPLKRSSPFRLCRLCSYSFVCVPCTWRFSIRKHTEFTRALVFHLVVPCLPYYRPTLQYHAFPHSFMGYFYFYHAFTMCSQLHHVVLPFFSLFPICHYFRVSQFSLKY